MSGFKVGQLVQYVSGELDDKPKGLKRGHIGTVTGDINNELGWLSVKWDTVTEEDELDFGSSYCGGVTMYLTEIKPLVRKYYPSVLTNIVGAS